MYIVCQTSSAIQKVPDVFSYEEVCLGNYRLNSTQIVLSIRKYINYIYRYASHKPYLHIQ